MSRFAQPSSFLYADDPLSEEPSGYGPHNASLNAALLRVDPLGVVHYDKPATGLGGNTSANHHHGASSNAKKNKAPAGGGGGGSDSDDEDGSSVVKPIGSTLGGLYRSIAAAAHNPLRPQNNSTISKTPKLICEPVPFLRPKVLPKSTTDARRFAPPGLCHSTAVGFESEDIIILFGGALQDTVQPTNDTWLYQVSDRRWNRLDTLEIATEALQQVRRRRGLSGDILPAPRSGHCAVAIRDTVLDQPIALQFKNRKAAKSDALSYAPNDPFAPALTDSAVDSSLLFPTANTNAAPYSPLKGGTKQPFSPVNHNVGGPSDPDQWSYRPSMLVFGGSNVSLGATYNDLWLFDVQCRAWKELSPLGTPPTPRWKCTGAALEQRMFIFGGENSSFDIVNELHMYDHISGMWRELRVVEPCPRPRLGHACAVVGHKMIIAGGLDKQSYLDHVALMLQTASGGTTNNNSRKASLNISSQQHNKNADLDSISDVWCLDMRTLLWRELATQDKKNSPFAVIAALVPGRHPAKPSSRRQSGQSDQLGRMRASSMSPARRESIAAHADDVTFGCMEGHVLLPFDDSVILHGGTLNGKLNTRIFSLNVANEHWSFHGEINTTSANSTNKLLKAQRALQAGAEPEDPMAIITSGMERKPQPRAQHAGCAFVSKMALQSLGNFAALGNVSLSTGLTPGTFSTATSTVPTLGGGSTSASAGVSQHTVHMSQPKETAPLIAQLAVPLAQQVSTRGLVTVYKNKPVVHKTTHVFFFGGMSFPRSVSDMWCLKLDIPVSHQNVDDSDHTIGDRIMAASKAGIVGNTSTSSVLGEKLLKMKPTGLGGSDARTPSTREEDGTFARSQREPAPEYYFPALAIKNEEDLEVERLANEAKLKSLDQTVASGGDPGSPTKKVGFAPPAVEARTPPRSHVNSPTSEKAFQSESSSSDSDDEARTAEESARRESERMKRRMAALREQIVNDAQAYILGSHHRPIHKSAGVSN